jgi:hypothetical protein
LSLCSRFSPSLSLSPLFSQPSLLSLTSYIEQKLSWSKILVVISGSHVLLHRTPHTKLHLLLRRRIRKHTGLSVVGMEKESCEGSSIGETLQDSGDKARVSHINETASNAPVFFSLKTERMRNGN